MDSSLQKEKERRKSQQDFIDDLKNTCEPLIDQVDKNHYRYLSDE